MLPGLVLLAAAATRVAANVEKVIFSGPAPANIPHMSPALSHLNLDTLAPLSSSVRTNLSRSFVAAGEASDARGQSAWLLLDHLTPGQRYEVRVCWAAIEPTSFVLDVHELDAVWQTPELIQSLAQYATARQSDDNSSARGPEAHAAPGQPKERQASILLLRVQAAADYFADDLNLMQNPPPVLVDIILDPFLYNVVPHSLALTASYVVLVSIVTWFLARRIASNLQIVARAPDVHAKKRE
ncbi:hypothetical protein HIM_09488 [Hirsutella minnesotensis 3608]|uniref:Uncharacterized protein n=1 Tax=Hirsutella minnesotensis 3608 TaxID=1043627 RepID=A0A0F8A334_9HYPO|nr:hypothetical protein HIM_09488 [Hirsutella minnesotensis 3608]